MRTGNIFVTLNLKLDMHSSHAVGDIINWHELGK